MRIFVAQRRHGRRRSAGQGLVEFALTVPIFLFLLFGIIEMGWAIYGYNTAQNMANEGVRRGMVLNRPSITYTLTGNFGTNQDLPECSKTPQDTDATILETMSCQSGVIPKGRFKVDLVVPTGFDTDQNVPPGIPVTATVRYTYLPIAAYPLNFGSNFTMIGFARSYTQ